MKRKIKRQPHFPEPRKEMKYTYKREFDLSVHTSSLLCIWVFWHALTIMWTAKDGEIWKWVVSYGDRWGPHGAWIKCHCSVMSYFWVKYCLYIYHVSVPKLVTILMQLQPLHSNISVTGNVTYMYFWVHNLVFRRYIIM